jgi:hypothetical protein
VPGQPVAELPRTGPAVIAKLAAVALLLIGWGLLAMGVAAPATRRDHSA